MRRACTGVRWVALIAVSLALSACIDGDAVFSSLSLFEDPPRAAKGFLGYADPVEKLAP